MDCSPLMNLSEGQHLSASEKAAVFRSLVATVKSKPAFDDTLVAKAANFLKSVNWDDEESSDAFLSNFGQTNDESLTDFIQSILVLISSPSLIITATTMEMLVKVILNSSANVRLSLTNAGLIPQLILTLNPQSLSFAITEKIHTSLMTAILNTIWLATPDGLAQLRIKDENEHQSVHETIFKRVLVPSEKYIWHLCMNHFPIVDGVPSMRFMTLIARLLQISPSYRPTLDFVLNMPVVLMIPSCLTFFEHNSSIMSFLFHMSTVQREWNDRRGNLRRMWRTVQRLLRMEGIEDLIEARLQNAKNGFGVWIVDKSIRWNNLLGMNLPAPR